MKSKRKYNEPIKLSKGKMIIPDEEVLFHEMQAAIDYKDKCEWHTDEHNAENRLNEKYSLYTNGLEGILDDEEFLDKLYHFAHYIQRMEVIRKCKEEKISISVFSDKYGNEYLMAKSEYPEYIFVNGKKKTNNRSISAHVGKLEDFEDGVNDVRAIAIAREKILKKAVDMLDFKKKV